VHVDDKGRCRGIVRTAAASSPSFPLTNTTHHVWIHSPRMLCSSLLINLPSPSILRGDKISTIDEHRAGNPAK
jgi:hypothetical protein